MSSTITEALDVRVETAAKNARHAAIKLRTGDSSSLREQIEADDALSDLARYARMRSDLEELAADHEVYGRASRHDLVRDLRRASNNDDTARRRLAAHQRTHSTGGVELRDIGGTGTVFATVPKWLSADPAPTSINNAPLLSFAKSMPTGSADVRLIGFNSPPTAAAQSAANAAVSSVDIADTGSVLPIRTYATATVMPLQLVEQSGDAISSQLIPAMVAAVDAKIDEDMLVGDGTSGTLTGILNTSSISTQTYTDTTPDAAAFITALETLIRKVEIGRGGNPVVVLHPRRWSWLREKCATATAPIPLSFSPPTGVVPGVTVVLNGSIHVVTDASTPTDRGTGTNEDICVVMRGTDSVDAFLSEPVVFLSPDASGSGTLKERLTVRRYAAFSAARLAETCGVLSGTGLAL